MSILPDFPESKSTLSWLTPSEKKLALRRIAEDEGQADEFAFKISKVGTSGSTVGVHLRNRWPGLYLALTDSKVWWLTLIMTVMVVSLSFNAYFPTIVGTLTMSLSSAEQGHEYGADVNVVLLLCVPPWVWATVVAVLVNRLV